MNILFSISSLEVGGAQSFCFQLSSALADENSVYLFDIHPLKSLNSPKPPLDPRVKVFSSSYEKMDCFLSVSIPKFGYKIFKAISNKFNLRNKVDGFQLKWLIRRFDISIISSHMYLSDLYLSAILRDHPIKIISTWHGCYDSIFYSSTTRESLDFFQSNVRKIYSRINGCIIISERQRVLMSKLDIPRSLPITKIYNGHYKVKSRELPSYADLTTKFIYGMVARGEKSKGWLEAIKSFGAVLEVFPNSILMLVGGGRYLDMLQQKFAHNRNIIFVGEVRNPIDYITLFDVALLPTYFSAESLPTSIVEYLSCRVPLISTRYSEIPLMIELDGEEIGLLIDIEDGRPSISQLTRAMLKYQEVPILREKYRSLSGQVWKKFNMNSCLEKYLNFFQMIKCGYKG